MEIHDRYKRIKKDLLNYSDFGRLDVQNDDFCVNCLQLFAFYLYMYVCIEIKRETRG
jgi:hypothetical protein